MIAWNSASDINLDHLAEVVFAKFLTVKLPFFVSSQLVYESEWLSTAHIQDEGI